MGTKFILGYGGSLAYFDGNANKDGWFRRLFWTYNHQHSDSSTRSPYYLFHAVKFLKENALINVHNFQMQFWGAIDMRNLKLAKELGIDDLLEVSGQISKTATRDKLNACSALFLPLESKGIGEPLFIPGKLFEYFFIGKPILALAEANSDAGKLLVKSNIAILTNGKDINQISKVLMELITNYKFYDGKSTDEGFLESLNWRHMAKKIAKEFDILLES